MAVNTARPAASSRRSRPGDDHPGAAVPRRHRLVGLTGTVAT
ncbi:MAG: hypothetical protein ABI862_13535 [Ilumatobacteraceae bacterium]